MITFKAKTRSGEIIKSAISDFVFPAGEAHIKVEPKRDLEPTEIAVIQPSSDSLHDDLFKLAMWNDYLYGKAQINRVLVIPYFPGARADRVSPGVEEPFGLSVYVEFISRLQLDQIIIFDPHSDITQNLLEEDGNKVTVIYSDELFEQPHIKQHMIHNYDGIIAPDKGAVERASAVADILDLPVYTAVKERDPQTGKLAGFSIDLPKDNESFYLIVDDICDRGGTFLGLLAATGLEYGRVDLFVSHGVFSSDALDILGGKFEAIYTTNSYSPKRKLVPAYFYERETPFLRYDIIHLLLEKVI